jgi:hypothetical protein
MLRWDVCEKQFSITGLAEYVCTPDPESVPTKSLCKSYKGKRGRRGISEESSVSQSPYPPAHLSGTTFVIRFASPPVVALMDGL